MEEGVCVQLYHDHVMEEGVCVQLYHDHVMEEGVCVCVCVSGVKI
jgi:hypothetical protein